VDVIVYGDVKELEMALKMQFPHSSVRVFRYSNSLVLTGFVDRPDYVSRIVRLAEDYSPKVINNITVGGVQQILLHVKVMEVSRTKLRTLGFDFASFSGSGSFISSISGLISSINGSTVTTTGGETIAFSIVDDSSAFFGFLEALRQYDLMKIMAEPTLVTVSGRPASFNVGGEFPILVPQSLGTVSIEYKKFGTQVDFVPIVLGNGNIRLEVRPRVSEIDNTRSVTINDTDVPGLRVREVDTGVEMRAGQTLALAGLIQNRLEAQNKGIPILADLPWLGAGFRRVTEQNNEIELLILVRPEFASALDPHEVPPGGPGLDTTSPNDCELYFRGYVEVPRCCDNRGGHPGPVGGVGVPLPGEAPAAGESVPAEELSPGEIPPVGSGASYGPNSPRWPGGRGAGLVRQPASVEGRATGQERFVPPTPDGAAADDGSGGGLPGLVGPLGYDTEN
jgi:pilus assembly protein CpaC